MGRHGGRSDGRIEGTAYAPLPHRSSSTGTLATLVADEEGVRDHAGGGTAVRWWEDVPRPARTSAVAEPWWDDAAVPPPVCVASADDRNPAVTFAPDADPFSAGGLFAPSGRDGEPAVVVHAAPDAAVHRPGRRSRPAPVGPGGTGGEREGAGTGSLVRPYVPQVETLAEPDAQQDEPPLGVAVGATASLPVVPPRRARRGAGPFDRVIDVAPPPVPPAPAGTPADEWSAPWTQDADDSPVGRPARSLFEPAAPRREPEGIWAPPAWTSAGGPLPSRKALRAGERSRRPAGAVPGIGGRELAGRPGRRIAKSGVLAVTAVGVVAASAPNALSALGWHLPGGPGTASQAQTAVVGMPAASAQATPDLAGSSLATPAGPVAPAASARDVVRAMRDVAAQRRSDAVAAARASRAATGAGRTLVDVARQQVAADAARKKAIADRASRNVVQDPRAYARLLVQKRGWSASQFSCLNLLWNRESGWNYRATNASSGAYGIPQALPGTKMASVAADWRTNPGTQILWGLNYIAERYGTPCGAWGHSQATGWY